MTARILLIEDNPANLELMTYLLRAFGYDPITATDGRMGLEAATSGAFDLILCDIQLPGVDGYEIAARLKADPALRAVPLVAVTALAMVGDRDRVLSTGFDGYLVKPINPETFVPQIETYLPSRVRPVPHASPKPDSTLLPASVSHHATILAVDNVPVNLELARSMLEPNGYRVFTAGTIEDALKLVGEVSFDLILSDVAMTGETGYDFIRAVKADERLSSIPFVFLTSTMTNDRDRERGLSLGATRYLFRPIEPETLLAELETCLRESRKAQSWQPS